MIVAERFSVARKAHSSPFAFAFPFVVAAFAAVAIVPFGVGCGSSSSPSTSSTAGQDSGASDASSAATATWTFGGGTTTTSFTSGAAPALVTIPAGGDVTASIGLQFGTPSGSGALTFSSANDINDVSPATLPTDNAAPTAADPENGASNNPVLYLSIFNAGPSTISFAEAPSVALSATGDFAALLSGDVSCQLDLYIGGSWIGAGEFFNQGQGLPASFTIPAASIPNESTLQFAPGQTLAAIGCD